MVSKYIMAFESTSHKWVGKLYFKISAKAIGGSAVSEILYWWPDKLKSNINGFYKHRINKFFHRMKSLF